jgi:ADP-heptose:LPS heptosyltransferase
VLDTFQSTINELKDEGFDYIIDLHRNIRTYRFKNKLKIYDFSFTKLNREKWLLVNFKQNKLPDKHIVDRYLETLYLFDVKNDNKGLEYFIPENEEYNIDEKHSIKEDYIAFAIGGQHNTKKMPNEMIRTICEQTSHPIVLLGGKEDAENGNIIASGLSNCLNLCGKTNLNESSDIVKKSKLVITHDTGLMHIAAAFKKNIISLWGNTVPEFGMYPYMAGPESLLCEVKNLKCRPCSKIGYNKCPKKHFDCMKKQDLNKINEHIIKVFNNE